MEAIKKQIGDTEIYLIRHGVTDFNASGKFQGDSDIPLNAEGQAQAEKLKERLLDEGVQPEHIFVSYLQRTRQTIEPFARTIGIEPEILPGIQEINGGILEGMHIDEIYQKYPETIKVYRKYPYRADCPQGETGAQVYQRAVKAFQYILQNHAGETVMLVSHGFFLQVLLGYLKGDKKEDMPALGLENTAVSRVLVSAEGAVTIDYWGDVSHLQ